MAPLALGLRFFVAPDHSSGKPLDPPGVPDVPLEVPLDPPGVPDVPLDVPLEPDDPLEPCGQLPDDCVAVQLFFASSSVYG